MRNAPENEGSGIGGERIWLDLDQAASPSEQPIIFLHIGYMCYGRTVL